MTGSGRYCTRAASRSHPVMIRATPSDAVAMASQHNTVARVSSAVAPFAITKTQGRTHRLPTSLYRAQQGNSFQLCDLQKCFSIQPFKSKHGILDFSCEMAGSMFDGEVKHVACIHSRNTLSTCIISKYTYTTCPCRHSPLLCMHEQCLLPSKTKR